MEENSQKKPPLGLFGLAVCSETNTFIVNNGFLLFENLLPPPRRDATRHIRHTRNKANPRGTLDTVSRDSQASEPGTGKRCQGEGGDRLWNLHDITRSCSLFGERESENQTSSKCATLQLLTFCDAWACRNPTLSIATFRCEVRVRISAFCLFLSGLILQAFLSDDQTLLLLY